MRPGSLPSRLLAVALLVLLLVAAGAAAVPAWRVFERNREAIAQQRDHAERFARLAAELEALRRHVAELEQGRQLGRYTLDQGSPALAAASLQERLKQAVTDNGGKLTTTQVLPPVTAGRLRRITVNARMAVTVEALQRILYEMESGVPSLVVDNLVVLARSRRARRGSDDAAPVLDVRFDLSGFMSLQDAGDAARAGAPAAPGGTGFEPGARA